MSAVPRIATARGACCPSKILQIRPENPVWISAPVWCRATPELNMARMRSAKREGTRLQPRIFVLLWIIQRKRASIVADDDVKPAARYRLPHGPGGAEGVPGQGLDLHVAELRGTLRELVPVGKYAEVVERIRLERRAHKEQE